MHLAMHDGGHDPERHVRVHVHVALASIVLAFFAPVVTWTLWLRDRGQPGRWTRRLLLLAILDTLLVLGFALSSALDLDMTATSEPSAELSTPTATTPRSLFDPTTAEGALSRTRERGFMAGAGGVELLLVGALAIAARRRHASAAPGIAVIAGLLAMATVSSVVLLAFTVTVGPSLGALLVALLAGSVALLAVGLAAAALRPTGWVQIGPLIGTPKAVALGCFYGVTGAIRIAILVSVATAALDLPARGAAEAFGLDLSWGPVGVGIFLLVAVVVAPVAEEVLFRGVLLPWAARWMKPAAALGWTAVIFAVGHLYYGAGALLIAHYGVVLGWARLRTGKLWAPIALHSLLNGTTAVALLATEA